MTGQDSRSYDVCGVGHALVDVQYAIDPDSLRRLGVAKGLMTLIDAERQRQLSRSIAGRPMACCSGGSAANTMIGVTALGGRAFLTCVVGDDEWGDVFQQDLLAAGVGYSAANRLPGVTGQCTVFITPDAERTMSTCLGVGSRIAPEHLDATIIRASRLVYLEGYLVTSDNGMATCREAVRLAREHGTSVALTLSDPSVVRLARGRFLELLHAGLDLLFCNEHEAMELTGRDDRCAAGQHLSEMAPIACMTCGAEGALLYAHGQRTAIAGERLEPVDTTGAGDAFAAGVIYGLTHGNTLEQAGALGARVAARVVARYGCRLDRSLAGEIRANLHVR